MIVNMSQKNLDIMTIYAYADKSYADLRDDWKDFLAYLLPTLYGIDAHELEDAMDEATVDSAEELCEPFPQSPTIGQIIREVSADVAELLQLGRELGLAAFHSGNIPAKVYAINSNATFKGDVQARWLMKFANAQRDPDFESVYNIWKELLDAAFAPEELDVTDHKQSA